MVLTRGPGYGDAYNVSSGLLSTSFSGLAVITLDRAPGRKDSAQSYEADPASVFNKKSIHSLSCLRETFCEARVS